MLRVTCQSSARVTLIRSWVCLYLAKRQVVLNL